jgi:hypothetical protein
LAAVVAVDGKEAEAEVAMTIVVTRVSRESRAGSHPANTEIAYDEEYLNRETAHAKRPINIQ